MSGRSAPRGTRSVAQAGVIAAVHAAVTLAVLQMPAQLGWGPVQLRISEALTVLALFTPAAIPGLALGTGIANASLVAQLGPVGLLDVVFGSLATLIGAWWTWHFRGRLLVALAGPVVANAFIVPAYLPVLLAALGLGQESLFGLDPATGWLAAYLIGVVVIFASQAVVIYGLGVPLALFLRRTPVAGLLGGSAER
ncbi:MAG: QueT transporter family protein [Coriobacteriia bacterium]|nr:QueT transporter family protein [Coriobacteriia bacterium]